jgi:hypothetical protein
LKWFLAGVWIASLAAAGTIGHHLASPVSDGEQGAAGVVESSLSEALRERDVLTRTFELATSLQRLDETNVEPAIQVFEAQRVGVSAFEARLFLFAWSGFDPAGAFAWAHAWVGPWRGTLESAAIYSWGYRSPTDALGALEDLEPARREELRESLISGWARSGDTQGLTDYLFSQPPGRERSRAIGVLLADLIQRENGPADVRRWAEGIAEGAPNQAKPTAFLTAGGALAQNNPKNARSFFEAHQDFEYARPALRTIARRWVDFHEPRDLFAWLVQLTPGSWRDDAVSAGFSRWWSSRPQEARAWLREAPQDEALDPALAVFAREVGRVSTARGVDWADRLQDPAKRRRTLAPLLRKWASEDRASARAWMKTHGVPSELQREFMNP